VKCLFKLSAILLLALWLPATLHCGLETAGLLLHEHGLDLADTGCATACEKESCSTLEDGAYKKASDPIKVSAPSLALCITQLVLDVAVEAAAESAPSVSPYTTDSPPELARTWQFTVRTALPARAPSLIA
jgi:hypothetical protein